MRTSNKPLFKTYELLAILAFIAAAITIAGLKLVY
jgi:hypothetical protein